MKLTTTFVLSGLLALSASASDMEKRYPKKGSKDIDTTILNYALTLEYLEADFYAGALHKYNAAAFKAAGYPAEVRERIAEIGETEATHVAVLKSVLGNKATKPCQYTFPYDSVDSFLALSAAIEGVGVSAYLGAAPLITSKDYLSAAASIVTVEARHQSVVGEFVGQDGVKEVFDTALDFSQVYSIASAFIKKCPRSNPSLPVQQFPALIIEQGTPKAGHKINFKFTPLKSRASKKYYAHFLNALSDIVVPLGKDTSAKVPQGLSGRVYVVITNSRTLSDSKTVAGPAFFTL